MDIIFLCGLPFILLSTGHCLRARETKWQNNWEPNPETENERKRDKERNRVKERGVGEIMRVLVCEGHWGFHCVMQWASNGQPCKSEPARGSAAKWRILWIMMDIIHKSCCHISGSESEGLKNSHTHASSTHSSWVPCGPSLDRNDQNYETKEA